jgi:hypothetical protein
MMSRGRPPRQQNAVAVLGCRAAAAIAVLRVRPAAARLGLPGSRHRPAPGDRHGQWPVPAVRAGRRPAMATWTIKDGRTLLAPFTVRDAEARVALDTDASDVTRFLGRQDAARLPAVRRGRRGRPRGSPSFARAYRYPSLITIRRNVKLACSNSDRSPIISGLLALGCPWRAQAQTCQFGSLSTVVGSGLCSRLPCRPRFAALTGGGGGFSNRIAAPGGGRGRTGRGGCGPGRGGLGVVPR